MFTHRRAQLIETLEVRTMLSTTYYVGSTPLELGADEQQRATVADVNALTLAEGDKVLFQAGQTFDGPLRIGNDGSGPLTDDVGPLKIGVFTIEAGVPVESSMETATLSSPASDGISVLNVAGVSISNLKVVGASAFVGGQVYGSAQPSNSYSGISFDNNLPGNVKLDGLTVSDVEVYGFGAYGITFGGSNGKSGYKNVLISRAKVHDNTHGGVESHGVFSSTAPQFIDGGYANTDVVVEHVTAWNNTGWAGSPNHSGSGIVLSDINRVIIQHSEAYENGAYNTHVGGPVGIWVWDVNEAVIQNNESHHNRTNSTADGGGFDIDGGVTNSVMQYNYSHDNDGAGYGIYQFASARSMTDNVVRYNISHNDARKSGYGAIDFWNGNGTNGIDGVEVYNNTFYLDAPAGGTVAATPAAVRFISGTTGVHIRNNNFISAGGAMLAKIDAKHTDLVFQGNNWYASSGGFRLKYFTKVYSSLSAFASGTGQEKLNGQVVGLSVDPGIAAIGAQAVTGNTDAYRIAGNSPVVNRGLNLWALFGVDAGETDYFGAALPRFASAAGYAFDIGAHEYQNSRHDVAVLSVVAPSTVVLGDPPAVVEVRVRNDGTFAENLNVQLRTANGTVIGTQPATLNAGQETVLSYTWDTTLTAEGQTTLTATATLLGNPPPSDANPANNSATTTVSVETERHAVTVTSVTTPSSATVGSPVPAAVTVRNTGNRVETFDLAVRATRAQTQEEIAIGSATVTLAPGDMTTVDFTWLTTGVPAGSYTLSAAAAGGFTTASASSQPIVLSVSVPGPAIASVSPGRVQAGKSVTVQISGSGFVNGSRISFSGGSGASPSVSNVQFISSNTLVATVSAVKNAKSAVWDLTVTNPDGTTASLADSFVVFR